MFAYGVDPTDGRRPDAPWRHPEEAIEQFELRLDRAFTLPEVAERLGISTRQVEMHVADGSLPAVDVGRGRVRRDLRVLDEDLDAFVEARRVGVRRSAPVSSPTVPDGDMGQPASRLSGKGGNP